MKGAEREKEQLKERDRLFYKFHSEWRCPIYYVNFQKEREKEGGAGTRTRDLLRDKRWTDRGEWELTEIDGRRENIELHRINFYETGTAVLRFGTQSQRLKGQFKSNRFDSANQPMPSLFWFEYHTFQWMEVTGSFKTIKWPSLPLCPSCPSSMTLSPLLDRVWCRWMGQSEAAARCCNPAFGPGD